MLHQVPSRHTSVQVPQQPAGRSTASAAALQVATSQACLIRYTALQLSRNAMGRCALQVGRRHCGLLTITRAGQLADSPATRGQWSIPDYNGGCTPRQLGPYLSAKTCAFASWIPRRCSTPTCRIAKTQHFSEDLAHRGMLTTEEQAVAALTASPGSHSSAQDSCDLFELHRGHHLIELLCQAARVQAQLDLQGCSLMQSHAIN